MSAAPTEHRPTRHHLMRYIGIGVAMVELAFLVAWMGLVFGMMDGFAAYLRLLSPILLDSLPALMAGMTLAAGVGGAVGLAAAAVHTVFGGPTLAKAGRSPGRD